MVTEVSKALLTSPQVISVITLLQYIGGVGKGRRFTWFKGGFGYVLNRASNDRR